MSEENVELAKEGIVAINETYKTGDIGPWQRHVEKSFDADVVLLAPKEAFTEGEWQGREGAVGFVANQMDVLEDMWLRADDFIDVDDDRLLVAITFGGRARHTGIAVELTPTHLFELRDGKVFRWQVFQGRDDALDAAGLSE